MRLRSCGGMDTCKFDSIKRQRKLNPVMTAKIITLRLPPHVYELATQLAERKHISLNRLFQDGLESLNKSEEQQLLYDAFTMLGQDRDETDVSYAGAAQAQVVLNERA